MAFYRDSEGAIWQEDEGDTLRCLIDPDAPKDEVIGDAYYRRDAEEHYGPFVKVRPIGWEEVC